MKIVSGLLTPVNEYKAHAPTVLAVVSGLGMILSKNYSVVISDIFQASTLIFGGASVVGLRHAVADRAGPGMVGLKHAVADISGPTRTDRVVNGQG